MTSGEDSDFVQPYNHVDIDITVFNTERLLEFIEWSLENEHGDLGLESSDQPKPPLSQLGLQIKRSPDKHEAFNIAHIVFGRAEPNVTLALARLELVHTMDTADETRPVSDRLPANIVALFDAGMRSVNSQPEELRDIGLKAIAAVAHVADQGFRPLKYVDLDRWLREAAMLSSGSSLRHVPHRSLEEILQATKGFLITTVPMGEQERYVEGYHYDFIIYAAGGYK